MRQRKVNWCSVIAAGLFMTYAMFFFSLLIPDSTGPIQYLYAFVLALIAGAGWAVMTSGANREKHFPENGK